MAVAYAVGFSKQGERQNSQVSRIGHGAAMANANTWRTFATAWINADGSGYIEVARKGEGPGSAAKTLYHFAFDAEEGGTAA